MLKTLEKDLYKFKYYFDDNGKKKEFDINEHYLLASELEHVLGILNNRLPRKIMDNTNFAKYYYRKKFRVYSYAQIIYIYTHCLCSDLISFTTASYNDSKTSGLLLQRGIGLSFFRYIVKNSTFREQKELVVKLVDFLQQSSTKGKINLNKLLDILSKFLRVEATIQNGLFYNEITFGNNCWSFQIKDGYIYIFKKGRLAKAPWCKKFYSTEER